MESKSTMTASSKMATKSTTRWAVFNKKTGKVATTRESNYNRLAFYSSRDKARAALREGKVFVDPKRGTVKKYF